LSNSQLIDAAVFVAQAWACFPCAGKVPLVKWREAASRDPEAVRVMFANKEADSIGVPMGQDAGVFLVDLDVKNGGGGLEWFAANKHRIPDTRVHTTPSGGVHLLFQWPVGRSIRNSASRLAPGVDIRGDGGFAVFPPTAGYSIDSHEMPAPAPAWLLDLIDPPKAPEAPRPAPAPRQSGDGTRYGLSALDNECQAILSAPDGAKHDTLNRAAFSIGGLVAAGELIEGLALQALASALAGIRHRCEDYPAAQKTLAGAFRAGMAKPREAPPRLIRRIVEEYRETRPEPPPIDAPPDHWSAEPEPDIGLEPEKVAPDIKPTGLPLIYFQDVKPALKSEDFIEGLLIKAAMSVTYGPSNCGKTFFMADLALHVALGLEWRGREVERAGVIYCAMEGSHGIANRVAAFALTCGLAGQEIPFAIIPVALNLLDPNADTSRLIKAIKEAGARMAIPVGLVVMDTLSRGMAGGNENSPEDMGALVANSDRIRQATGAHVAWIHHSGKDQAQGARGHSLLRAATDTEIEISRADNDSPSIARVTKQRELEIDGVFGFTLKRVELGLNHRGKSVTSCVVEATDDRPAKARVSLTNGEAMALRILHDVMATQPVPVPYQAAEAGVKAATSKHAWREAFFARSTIDTHEAKKKAFNRAADGLAQKSQIGVHHDTVWAV
jgi:hypothetical protein